MRCRLRNERSGERYPRQSASDSIYAVFDVAKENFYSDWTWDYSKLPGRRTGRKSAEPFAVTLPIPRDTAR